MPQTPTARFFRILAGHTVVFGLSSLVRPLSQLILVRLHTNTHFIRVEDYAAWTLLQVGLNIGIVVLNLGMATAFFRHYLLAGNEDERKQVVGRSFRLTLLLALVGGGLLFITADYWSAALVGRPGYGRPAMDLALAVFGNTLSIVPLALLRAEGRWKPFLAFNLLRFCSLIGLNALFIIGLRLELRGITLAIAVTNVLIALLFLPLLRGKMDRGGFTRGWGTMLRYGTPLVAIDITMYVLNSIPHVLLGQWRPPGDVALFGFALRIAFIAQVAVVMPFTIAFAPQLFRAGKEEQDPRPLYARTMGYIWTLASGMALAVTLFAPELADLLGKNVFYHQAIPQVLPLAFGIVFYGIFVVFSSGASLKDKTWIFPLLLLFSGLTEVILSFLWIPSHGPSGAAWAVFGGFAVLSFSTFAANQLIYPVRFPWVRVIHVTFAAGLLLLAYHLLPFGADFAARVLFFAAFPVILLATGYLDRGEREAVKRWLK